MQAGHEQQDEGKAEESVKSRAVKNLIQRKFRVYKVVCPSGRTSHTRDTGKRGGSALSFSGCKSHDFGGPDPDGPGHLGTQEIGGRAEPERLANEAETGANAAGAAANSAESPRDSSDGGHRRGGRGGARGATRSSSGCAATPRWTGRRRPSTR
jgi:hypothetical protein